MEKKEAKEINVRFARSTPRFVWGFFKAWILGYSVTVNSLAKDVEIVRITPAPKQPTL